MTDALRKLSEDSLNTIPSTPYAETPPAVDELEARRMKREAQSPIVNAAETVGNALGSAVENVRSKVHSGLELVKDRSAGTGEELEHLKETVRHRTEDFKDESRRRLADWRRTAQRRIEHLRRNAARVSRERPAELILAIGGVAMLAGFILRLWRSNHE
ncbi:MAG: hypothetical protein ACM3JB_21855 [Acidobacteriaceae bacterium]